MFDVTSAPTHPGVTSQSRFKLMSTEESFDPGASCIASVHIADNSKMLVFFLKGLYRKFWKGSFLEPIEGRHGLKKSEVLLWDCDIDQQNREYTIKNLPWMETSSTDENPLNTIGCWVFSLTGRIAANIQVSVSEGAHESVTSSNVWVWIHSVSSQHSAHTSVSLCFITC